MKERLCGFLDRLWDGNTTLNVLMTNWAHDPVVIEKGTFVGRLEEASLVDGQDSLWTDTNRSPRFCRVNSTQVTRDGISRREELQKQLVVGSNCSEEERLSFIECLLSLNHIFTLVD